jgi:hypothetical protein
METNIEAILKSVCDHEERITRLEQALLLRPEKVNEPITTSKKMSFREILRMAKPPTNVEKVLLAGYYLELHEGLKCFNAIDIEQAFQTAKEPELSNTLAFINQNIKNGSIMEVKEKKDSRKAYTLTASGEDLVKKSLGEAGSIGEFNNGQLSR